MKNFFILLLSTFLFVKGHAQNFVRENKGIAEGEMKGARTKIDGGIYTNASPNFDVYYYRCEWTVDPAVLYITGKVTPYFTISANALSVVFDINDQLTVDSVTSHGAKLLFSQDTSKTLTINESYEAGQKDSLSIYYHGVPPQDPQSIGDFTINTHDSVPVLWTLSEPYGARDWWPCRNGLDDKADSIDIYITHPSKYTASSNGLMIGAVMKADSTIVTHFKHRYPIVSYLVAIAVTNYSVLKDSVQLGSNVLPLVSYIYPEDSALFQTYHMYLQQGLQLFNTYYGDYPFMNEKYGQTEFGFNGGMEHQTNSFVVTPNADLVAHELSHQWFGDKVTCASWQDIWLHEGFAVFSSDFFWMENFLPYYYPLYVAGDLAYIVTQPNGSVFVTDTTSTDRIFDERLTYCKGGFLVRMLRWTLGDSLFFQGLRQYLNDPQVKYGFAHTSDLQRNLDSVSGMDLTYFFKQWFYGQGYPMFTVQWSENTNNYVNFTINQTTSDSSVLFYKVPLQLVFKNATQEKTVVIQDTVNNQQVSLDLGFQADSVLIDPQSYLISAHDTAIKIASPNRS